MMTRYTMLVWPPALAIGMLATPLRRQLATPWPWLGAALSLLVFAPNAWWQWQHDFIYLDFVQHIHARDVRIGRTDGFLVRPAAGRRQPADRAAVARRAWCGWCSRKPPRAGACWPGCTPCALLLFRLTKARDYYLAPAYPMLLAAGAVALEARHRAPASARFDARTRRDRRWCCSPPVRAPR